MASSTNPTWYDVLGVPRDATPEEIKAAWRNATDKFEPGSGSGQFRMFNDAADVLLDPEQRAAYDAGLDRDPTGVVDPPRNVKASQAPPKLIPGPHGDVPETGHADRLIGRPAAGRPRLSAGVVLQGLGLLVSLAGAVWAGVIGFYGYQAPIVMALLFGGAGLFALGKRITARSQTPVTATAEGRAADAQTPSANAEASNRPASRALVLVTLGLALLTAAALVAAGYLGLKVRDEDRAADARDRAPATAERAAKAILEYDYRRLPADRKRASAYLTSDFRKDYLENFTLLERQKDGTPGAAVQTKTVVTASVLGSGVMDADEDRVRVLVYVNQESRKPGVDPQIFQNRVALTMEKDGNRWLVDDLKSY